MKACPTKLKRLRAKKIKQMIDVMIFLQDKDDYYEINNSRFVSYASGVRAEFINCINIIRKTPHCWSAINYISNQNTYIENVISIIGDRMKNQRNGY